MPNCTNLTISPAFPWLGGITGLIFDMDGVLIQSRGAHARAFQEVLAEFGVLDFHYDDWAGWRTPEVFRALLGRRAEGLPGEAVIAECSLRKSRRARELVAAERPIDPECVAVVQRLGRRYRLALASSGSRRSVDAFLDWTGLGEVFQSTLSGDDVTNAKPDPEIFRRSMEAMGAQPEACAVVEDAVAGIVAARRAGARAIGFSPDLGSGTAAALADAGAHPVVTSLGELAGIFQCA